MKRQCLVAVVDDDASLCDALIGLIQSYGYEAEGFNSADEYLATERLAETCCLITDIQMPGLSGFDLIAAIRRLDLKPQIIMITARDEPEFANLAERAGVVRFLQKPLQDDQLLSTIEAAIGPPG